MAYYRLMKADSGVIHYPSRQDYLNKQTTLKKIGKGVLNKADAGKVLPKKLDQVPKEKVELSKEALEKGQNIENPSETKGKGLLKKVGESLKSAAGAVVDGAGLAKPNIPFTALDFVLGKSKTQKIVEPTKVEPPVIPKIINKPAIILIGGLDFGGISSDDGGIWEMSEYIPDAETFGWNDEDEIIEEIKKRPAHQPVILVGHSLGGDTAVSVANKLNTMEHGFKTVDLLVTMDSLGFNNDIIPRNVKSNLNFIGDNDFILSDAPNIARDTDSSKIVNELVKESHADIDNNSDVQFKIFSKIAETLGDTEKLNQMVKGIHEKRMSLISSNYQKGV